MKSFKSTILFLYFFISLFLYFPPISPVLAADTYQYDWTKAVGGSGNETGRAISVDSLGNIYVVGILNTTVDFDPGAGTDNHTSNGVQDIFLTKYNSDGSYAWTKTVGGSGADNGYSVTTDSSRNVYLTGYFNSTVDFDPGSGTDNHTSNGIGDIFLTKYNSDGSYGWTKTFGGSGADYGSGVTTDSSGNIYSTGYFSSTVDFDPGSGVENHTSNGGTDIFLTKYNSDGSYAWTKTVGGSGTDYGSGVTTDPSGNIYSTGYFSSTVDFDPGVATDNHISNGGADIFLTKYNSDGSYGWTKTIGGSGTDQGLSITIDSSGNVYTTGIFQTTVDFDPGSGVENHTSNGSEDIFLTKYNSGGSYSWTKTVGGSGADDGLSVTTDSLGNIYLGGYFNLTVDFDPGSGVENRTSNAATSDAFILSLDSNGIYRYTHTFSSNTLSLVQGIIYDSYSNSIYATGYFASTTIDFDPLGSHDNKSTNGGYDISLTKLSHVVVLPTSTPTPAPGESSQVNGVSTTDTPICSDTIPVSTPDLFQIDMKDNQAQLFFTPISNTDRFYISYSSINTNGEEHGVETTLFRDGVQSYTINLLNPGSTYYFKVRGQIGCMPGSWSNILKANTNSKGNQLATKFYEYGASTLPAGLSTVSLLKVESLEKAGPTNFASPEPTAKAGPTPTPIQKSKFCILWWCFGD